VWLEFVRIERGNGQLSILPDLLPRTASLEIRATQWTRLSLSHCDNSKVGMVRYPGIKANMK